MKSPKFWTGVAVGVVGTLTAFYAGLCWVAYDLDRSMGANKPMFDPDALPALREHEARHHCARAGSGEVGWMGSTQSRRHGIGWPHEEDPRGRATPDRRGA